MLTTATVPEVFLRRVNLSALSILRSWMRDPASESRSRRVSKKRIFSRENRMPVIAIRLETLGGMVTGGKKVTEVRYRRSPRLNSLAFLISMRLSTPKQNHQTRFLARIP